MMDLSVYLKKKICVGFMYLCAVVMLSNLFGCATTVQTSKQIPARYAEAAELRRVASLGFKGSHYESQVNAAFETMLVNHQYNGQPYFTVADRTRTKELMGEMKRSLSGEVDSSTAIKFGKKIGVQGIYFGDITTLDFNTHYVQSNQQYCMRQGRKKCKEWGNRPVNCSERTASITLVPRLINVETGQVVYREQYIGKASSMACPGYSSKDDQTLLTEALQFTISNIRGDIAPTTSLVSVKLMDEPSNLDAQETEQFASGLEFSKGARMDRACEIWRALNQRVTSRDNALLFNVAVCEELDGNLDQALKLYTLVDRRLTIPDTNVSQALNRITSTLNTKASAI